MNARIGHVVYWTASAMAVSIAVFGVVANVIVGGGLIPDIGAITIGGLIWLVGRATLYALTGSGRRAQQVRARPNSN